MIWVEEEVLEAHDDCANAKYWLPILTKDIEANVSIKINVGVIANCFALHLRRIMWVCLQLFSNQPFSVGWTKQLKV